MDDNIEHHDHSVVFRMPDSVTVSYEFRDEWKQFDGTPKEFRREHRLGEYSSNPSEQYKAKRQRRESR